MTPSPLALMRPFRSFPVSALARRFAVLALAALALALVAAGCAHMPRMLGGSGNVEMRLDGEQQHEARVPAGSLLALDMRDPGLSGYVFAGTSFDPVLLRLDGIEPFEDGRRVRYTFTALAEGECDVVIKIRKPEPNLRPDIFKQVKVTVTK
ncbi:hypothetical protein SAMN04488503_1569 [Humidesulfovibrio mexicanus]|uniref:Chagasin family peptidase inhibitor I42 n=1 Tax=Humidesulfovibrio mexicanus TaxID=147047 RepID=A0A238ZSC7_9BACT|nr:hypothetical protein [Humidesulfovibrio mexicanus]SNR86250.1 hypothetical protein SAMN04488503_1569 [Humidesulfovibrio mexicanus]